VQDLSIGSQSWSRPLFPSRPGRKEVNRHSCCRLSGWGIPRCSADAESVRAERAERKLRATYDLENSTITWHPASGDSKDSQLLASLLNPLVRIYWLRDFILLVGTTPVDVVIPDDVILIEIGSRLDFDEEGRNLAWIGQAMLLADRDIGRLVLA